MAAVIALHRLAAGRNDFRPADAQTTAVIVTPVTVDRMAEAGLDSTAINTAALKLSNRRLIIACSI